MYKVTVEDMLREPAEIAAVLFSCQQGWVDQDLVSMCRDMEEKNSNWWNKYEFVRIIAGKPDNAGLVFNWEALCEVALESYNKQKGEFEDES